ncbi:MAG TPA: TIGR03936 family radical SAM-associated protein [Cryptosporangiaceae bacterium]|nr:TIGR03936 family radical SAM-associated protein [Cryptosporangiaceae bacterium]
MRYAKRGRLRFTSHRDFARAFERALRRAEVPMGFSAGFSPHPKISYVNAAPTGVASEAEYLEIGLAAEADPDQVRNALDAALPPGLDIIEVVVAGTGSLADQMQASHWRVELPGVEPAAARRALELFMEAAEVPVDKLTKSGRKIVDVRPAVVSAAVVGETAGEAAGESRGPADGPCAILEVVVRLVTPAVRPDDILTGLRDLADLDPPVPPRTTRVAQGILTAQGRVADPLDADRGRTASGAP